MLRSIASSGLTATFALTATSLSIIACQPPGPPVTPIESLIASSRTTAETKILATTQAQATALLDGSSIRLGDPLRLNGFVRRAQAVRSPDDAQRNRAHAILAKMDDVSAYLTSWVHGVSDLESLTSAVVGSQLVAVIQNRGHLSNTANAAAIDSSISDLQTRFTTSSAQPLVIPAVLLQDGSDCAEAPPASGKLPPPGLNADGTIAYESLAIEGPSEKADLTDLDSSNHRSLQRLVNRYRWHQSRKTDPARDLDALASRYLSALRDVLTAIANSSPTSGTAIQLNAFESATAALGGAVGNYLRYGAILTASSFPSAPADQFDFVSNTPNEVDGRNFPILNSIPFPELPGGGDWLGLPVDAPVQVAIPADFTLKTFSRPIDHLDYQLRVMGQPTVLRSYAHLPQLDGTIALGQTLSFDGLAPSVRGDMTYVLQAVPMDSANHPTHGSCSYMNVAWVPQAEIEAKTGGSGSLLTSFESIAEPPLPFDPICESFDYSPVAPLNLPDRNIYIYRDYSMPNDLSVVTSGESIRFNNLDTVPRRFRSTSDSVLALLGSTGGFSAIDTGSIQPGESIVVTLPKGLPSPYWINLLDVSLGETKVDQIQRTSILVQNIACLPVAQKP